MDSSVKTDRDGKEFVVFSEKNGHEFMDKNEIRDLLKMDQINYFTIRFGSVEFQFIPSHRSFNTIYDDKDLPTEKKRNNMDIEEIFRKMSELFEKFINERGQGDNIFISYC